MHILPLYAAILALLFVCLSANIVRLRRHLKISIGHADNNTMLRAIRVHANFAEYVPITLVLILLIELQNTNAIVIHGLCASLLIGRCLHAYGLSHTSRNFLFRSIGMVLTFTTIIASAAYLLTSHLLGLLM